MLAQKRMLALAAEEGVEQIQGGKPMQTKMNEDDKQGPHVNSRNLNKHNTIITTRHKHTKGGKNSSHLSNGAKSTDTQVSENTMENWKSHSALVSTSYFFNYQSIPPTLASI